jgi:hypothetical protein
VAHELTRRGQHGAVAADDDREIGFGFAFRKNMAAAPQEERAQITQRGIDFRAAQLADERNPTEIRRHAPSVQ